MHKSKEPKDRENLNEKVINANVAKNTEHQKKKKKPQILATRRF